MKIDKKIAALRAQMKINNLDAYIVPSSDPHQSEYVAEHWQARKWISGFTGSMGTAVVTQKHVGVWADSRYFIQAEKEFEGTEVVLHKMQVQGAPEFNQWLSENLSEGSTVGCDGLMMSLSQVKSTERALKKNNIQLDYSKDLIAAAWTDRPTLPDAPVFEHDAKYAGRTRAEKLSAIRAKMTTLGADYHFVSTLDDICWTLNLRGSDVEANPVFIAYCVIGVSDVHLFIDENKVSANIKSKLKKDSIVLKPYDNITHFLNKIPAHQTILVDTGIVSMNVYNAIAKAKTIEGDTISIALKAIKNEVEIGHIRRVMIKDGVALTRMFRWFEQEITQRGITEAEFAEKLITFRAEQKDYYGESFGAIVGYKGNGAIVHYHAEHGSCATIKNEGILLVDSGGQYHDGTTDITRTIALSEPTAEQKRNFTLVLKGHIALAVLRFPHGTKGVQMDILARQFLWANHLNYGHGTGHGVGFFLNVHEPPQGVIQGVASRGTTVHEPGMFTSNEPGFYKTNEYGIRIENLILAREAEENEYGRFMFFETVTLFPIDTRLVDKSILTKEEKFWLNNYHKLVLKKLSPKLDAAEKAWMKTKCKPI